MNRGQLYLIIALALMSGGLAVAVPWAVICWVIEGGLVMNGAWIIAVLFFAGALVATLKAWRYEWWSDVQD